jgi:hypothetical protein
MNNTRSRVNVINTKKNNSKNVTNTKNIIKNVTKKNNSKNVNSSIKLGINVEESASQREVLERLQNNLKKNNDKVKKFQGKITELRKFNNKLSDGYQLSLKMVVDVSDLLHRYVGIFEMLETLMTNIESTFEFNEEDFRYIRDLTEKNIEDIRTKMNKQVDSMVVVFEKEGLSKQASELRKLKETSAEISLNASNISKTTPIIKSNTKNTKNVKNVNNAKSKNNTKSTPKKTLMQKFNKILYD